MIRSAVWALTSIVFVVVSSSQIERIRHAGGQVPTIQTAMLYFWILMIPLWLFQAWQSWRHLRANKQVL
ncbi:MAG: hypothetical protein M3O02_05660 [Acidobacteriota bacterium]|nr:hypothetical protein [Acidobacteriota bacterium]